MRVLVSGGTGFVGRFVVEALADAGHEVTVLARTPPKDGWFVRPPSFIVGALDPERDWRPVLEGFEGFVHAAFHHLPGRYRGGEGDDADGFRRLNLDGTIALFEAAKAAGIARTVFLSSRAVYGTQPVGARLTEETEPHPDTLYGETKLAAERRLAALAGASFAGVSLRVTGVYGEPGRGRRHKWSDLFDAFLDGRKIAPRVATEVHGRDVAQAVALMLASPAETISGRTFNVSDILLDRADLLAIVRSVAGSDRPLPPRADASTLNAMDCARLKALGWRPGGRRLLEQTVRCLARQTLHSRHGQA